MKIRVTNKFHNTEAVFSIKDEYRDSSGTLDAVTLMSYEVYANNPDKAYCQRKLRDIKRDLCGSNECKCVFTCEEI